MKNIIPVLLALIVIVSVGGLSVWYFKDQENYAQITSYTACADAGYPILETNPEQCRLPDGRTFTKNAEAENNGGSASSTPLSAFNTSVSFKKNDTRTFSDGLSLTLTALNDSRCAPGVQCIWQGEISAVFSARPSGASTQEIRMGTINNTSITALGYSFTLESATPETATIRVASRSGEITLLGTVSGYIHTGPVCPVEQMPPNPNCADRPYENAIVTIKSKANGATTVAKSNTSGNFSTTLTPGVYIVEIGSSSDRFPRCEIKEFTIASEKTSSVDISCDSGIR
jgi:hypothetical protein